MTSKNSQDSNISNAVASVPANRARERSENGTTVTMAEALPHSTKPAGPTAESGAAQPQPLALAPRVRRYRKWLLAAAAVAAVATASYFLAPFVNTAMNTVSTDDAYVNGHMTFVAPRVPGQVTKVLVDDNQRVKKGDLLVELDKEPYLVQVALKRAGVRTAESNLAAAESTARGLEAQLGTERWVLQNASEKVDAQIALLRSEVATLRSQEAILDLARADFERAKELLPTSAVSRQDYDHCEQQLRSAAANVVQAQEAIAQTRVSLGLAPEPEKGKSLSDAPPNLNQTYSSVRAALAACMQTTGQLGLPLESTDLTPNQALEKFRQLDKRGDIDRILRELVPKTPMVLQAKAALGAARHDLEQAELNLRYCDVVSEIDGVVTSRNVNPGNSVQAGESLMAIRSVKEIWIDANFKETQLADLRIGQRVRCDVDMYGGRREFEGRITGFTMGTGQTLSLLPPQNATGNFVKIVQRLPVRVELTHYDPDKAPLFVGISVTPYVYYKEPPTGPNAGELLQPGN
jgi:membrane fusion protein (multidrug efflux system)